MQNETRRLVVGVAGLLLVVGFFLPWVHIPGLGGASGWDLMRDPFGFLPLIFRAILALCPLSGAMLAIAAYEKSSEMERAALYTGLAIPVYGLYWGITELWEVVGLGLFAVLLASATALVLGLSKK